MPNVKIACMLGNLRMEPYAAMQKVAELNVTGVHLGVGGGPFAPECETYTVTNSGPDPVDWSVAVSEAWVEAAPGSGTLGAGDSTPVDVCIHASAATLPIGVYFADATSRI